MDEIADVYAVGPSPYVRWRSFADATRPWSPNDHHDALMSKRDYHARNAYELGIILGITPDYTCRQGVEYLRVCAVVELRVCEVELAAFQLTCNQIVLSLRDPDALFAAARFLHGAHLHLYDATATARCIKKGRKNVLNLTPYRTDTPKVLAHAIDMNLHALHVLLQNSLPLLKLQMSGEAEGPYRSMRRLGQLLGLAIRALDAVVRISEK